MAIRGCGLFLAFGLSLASLAGILLVLFGGLDKGSKVFDNLFAMQIDLTTFFANEPDGSSRGMIAGVTNMTAGNIPGMNADNQAFAQALWQERRIGQLKQFYNVYLWDWCSSDAAVVDSNAFCSAETFAFTFDPFKAMNLTRSIGSKTEDGAYPEALRVAMQAYNKSSTWLRISYIIAGIAKLVELIFGLVAVTSKWGSLCAAFTALVSFFLCEYLPMERRLSTYESSKTGYIRFPLRGDDQSHGDLGRAGCRMEQEPRLHRGPHSSGQRLLCGDLDFRRVVLWRQLVVASDHVLRQSPRRTQSRWPFPYLDP